MIDGAKIAEALRAQARALVLVADAIETNAAPELRTHVPIAQAATLSGTSTRVLSREISKGVIAASGGKRSRIVEVASLQKWIAARAVRVPSLDDELDARVAAKIEAAE